MNENSKFDKKKLLFTHLITMLSMSAMQQMGKLKNPVSGKIELQLQAAQITIDLLDMLEEKTKGNLDQEEARLLKDTISSLKLNYVETEEASKSEKTEEAASPKTEEKKEPASESKSPKANKEQAKEKKSEPTEHKFHKSYE